MSFIDQQQCQPYEEYPPFETTLNINTWPSTTRKYQQTMNIFNEIKNCCPTNTK